MLSVWVVASQRNKAHADGESREGAINQTLRGVGGEQKGKTLIIYNHKSMTLC